MSLAARLRDGGPPPCPRRADAESRASVDRGFLFHERDVQGPLDYRTWLDALAGLVAAGDLTPPPRRIVALDLETTGLGGSTAKLAVLGLACWEEGRPVRLRQWQLEAIRGELPMLDDALSCLETYLEPGAVLITFNGASFDLPFLRARGLRLRRSFDRLQAPHLDLLGCARRIFRGTLPGLSLHVLEARLLGTVRDGDLPGSMVPAVFEAHLFEPTPHTRDAVEQVLRHNALDLLVLFSLVPRFAAEVERPRGWTTALGVARHLTRVDATARAEAVLTKALEAELGASEVVNTRRPGLRARLPSALPSHGGEGPTRLLLALVRLLQRRGAHGEAAAWLARGATAWRGESSIHEALAKDLEHRQGRPERALEVASGASVPNVARLERLARKVERGRLRR